MLMSTTLSMSHEPHVVRNYETETGCGLTIEVGQCGEKQVHLSFSDSEERLEWAKDVYHRALAAHEQLLEAVEETQAQTAPF